MGHDTIKNILTPISDVLAHCNGRIKCAPDGTVLEVMYTSKPVFNWGGFEASEKERRVLGPYTHGENIKARGRANKRVFDLCACNGDIFDLFITLTLNPERVDRYDYAKAYEKLRVWLDNRVRRKGLAYVLVPERHKDGAIHFHGLINSSAVQLKDSGHKDKKGRKVYNVIDWLIGWTTAVKLTGTHLHVCKYITKYIRKQADEGLIGGRYYLHGGNLKEPRYKYVNFQSQPEGKAYTVEEAGLTVVYVTDMSNCQWEDPREWLSRARSAALAGVPLDGLE